QHSKGGEEEQDGQVDCFATDLAPRFGVDILRVPIEKSSIVGWISSSKLGNLWRRGHEVGHSTAWATKSFYRILNVASHRKLAPVELLGDAESGGNCPAELLTWCRVWTGNSAVPQRLLKVEVILMSAVGGLAIRMARP